MLEVVDAGLNAAVAGEGERYGSVVIVPNGFTDLIWARFSLGSESELPVDGDFSAATMRLEATFYSDNVVAGSGVNGDEGDITVEFQLV